MRSVRRTCLLVGSAVAFLAVAPAQARAALPPLHEVLETLMNAQMSDAVFLAFLLDARGPVHLDYVVSGDELTRTFAYALRPGQTFLGQPIELAGSGGLVAPNRYAWTTTGQVAGAAYTADGTSEWIGDPVAITPVTIKHNGVDYKVTGDGVYTTDPPMNASSTAKYTLTPVGGGAAIECEGKDIITVVPKTDGTFITTATAVSCNPDPKTTITLFNDVQKDAEDTFPFRGTGALDLVPVPEPGAAALLGVGLVGLVGVAGRGAATRRAAR